MREVVLRDGDKSARILVDAVDYPGAKYSPDARKTVAAVRKQSVHERPVGISGCRMNDHSDRFVYYYYVTVLENYIKRNILRLGFVCDGRRKHHLDRISRREFQILRRRPRVHEYISG